jgi:hypothetical protein
MKLGPSSEALTDAAFNGDLDTMRSLIEDGADVNAAGRVWNPLHAAIENDQIAAVHYLLSVGADPDFRYNDWPALHHAIDAEMDGYQQTNASILPSAYLVRMLVEAGADTNIECDGETPLQLAEWWHHEAVIKYLRSQAAQPAT